MKQKREPEAVLGTKPATKKAKKTPAKADMKIQAKTKKNNEIDDIFGSATAGKTVKKGEDDALLKDIAEKVAAARKSNADTKKPKIEGSKDDIFGEETKKNRKRTDEGYAIYTEEELGLTKTGGGDTPLCPFDCDCCY